MESKSGTENKTGGIDKVMAVAGGSAVRGGNIACLLLWLLHHPGERLCHVGYAMAPTMVTASARRECMCLQFLQLLKSSSGLLPCTLPTMGSVNSVHSEIQQDNWSHEQDQQDKGNTVQYHWEGVGWDSSRVRYEPRTGENG